VQVYTLLIVMDHLPTASVKLRWEAWDWNLRGGE
jgi:hypothetical protein